MGIGNRILLTGPSEIRGGHVAQFWPVRPKEGFAEGLLGKVFLLLNRNIQRNMPPSPWDVVASGCVPGNWNSHLRAIRGSKLRTKPTH